MHGQGSKSDLGPTDVCVRAHIFLYGGGATLKTKPRIFNLYLSIYVCVMGSHPNPTWNIDLESVNNNFQIMITGTTGGHILRQSKKGFKQVEDQQPTGLNGVDQTKGCEECGFQRR